MTTRDIPFDEEYPDRPDAAREAFADIAPLADLEARRRRVALDMDIRVAEAKVRDARERDEAEESDTSSRRLMEAKAHLAGLRAARKAAA